MEKPSNGGFVRGLVIPVVLAAVLLLPVGIGITTAQADKQGKLDCSECHTCEHPSKARPCLKTICPRHEAMSDLQAELGPATVVLNELENLYVAVIFDHEAHARMVRFSGGCETCHHFTPPDALHPACSECHPSEIQHEDLTQPGLKGAYHRNCMSCHQEWDKDTACEICHEKKGSASVAMDPGSVIHHESHYQPLELDELIMFPTSYEEGDQVPFHHKNHSQLYERDCSECHREQSCTRCHVQGEELHPMGEPAETDLHETCYGCHDTEKCDDCHGRDPDDLFEHADTGWPLRSYHARLNCRTCHGATGQFKKLTPVCENCHPGGWSSETFTHAVTGVALGEVHGELDCGDCHVNGVGEGVSCDTCHDDGRGYEQGVGFGEG